MPFLLVDGARTHFVQRQPVVSRGAPVLFVHGAGGSHQHWLYQVRDLPEVATYALDLPGHGRSEGAGRTSISDYGDWLISFLEAAAIERAVLVGHSMGGAISLDVALRFPGRVVGLGLIATGARLRVAPAILDGILQDPEAAVGLICDWAFGPEAPTEMVRLGRRQMAATPPQVLHGDLAACDAFNLMDRLREVPVPALVLCGTNDQLTPAKYATHLRDQLPCATLHLVEGAGHMVMIERPEAVLAALTGFLGRLPPLKPAPN
jgi:pimeloyl-ACP methyl ester carboxylesterase